MAGQVQGRPTPTAAVPFDMEIFHARRRKTLGLVRPLCQFVKALPAKNVAERSAVHFDNPESSLINAVQIR